jgi:hypothetical protein
MRAAALLQLTQGNHLLRAPLSPIWAKQRRAANFAFVMNPETSESNETAPASPPMREPPGRLGDIVRRLKRIQPLPSRIVPLDTSAEPHRE